MAPNADTQFVRNLYQMEPQKFGMLGAYAREMLDVEESRDRLLYMHALRFSTMILSGRTITEHPKVEFRHTHTFEMPSNWWQHLKQAVYSRWDKKGRLQKRFPVRLSAIEKKVFRVAEIDVTQHILYPQADYMPPPSQFGMPVIWEEASFMPIWEPQTGEDGQVSLNLEGPSRYLNRHEIANQIYRESVDRYSGYANVDTVLDWLSEHGVNPDQLVRRT
jgi:hypothetical protein